MRQVEVGAFRAVVVVVGLLALGLATPMLSADVSGVSLGGAADFAVLSTYDDLVIDKGYVYGDAGVGPGSEFWINDASFVTGSVYVPSMSAFHKSKNATVGSVVVGDLTDVILDAIAAADQFAAETGTDLGDITASTTIFGTSGMNIFQVNDFVLDNGDTITLSGPSNSWFVFNVSSQFIMDGYSVEIVNGPITASHILFNVRGSGDVTLVGNSTLVGTLLGPDRNITLSSPNVSITGSVIGHDILMTSGSTINHTPYEPVPEPATLTLLGLGLVGLGLRLRHRD